MSSEADRFFSRATTWKGEIEELRSIVLGCGLSETIKWRNPCYTSDARNIVLIHVFKEYCALLFFKGALIKDDSGLLIQQSSNVQAARQARFTDVTQIVQSKKALKNLILQAIEIEKSGIQVAMKKTEEYAFPEELQQKIKEFPRLKTAIDNLTPGRQRGYLLYFSSAKQSATRASRIEKNIQRIMDGKGLND